MRAHLEATPDELRQHSGELLDELAKAFRDAGDGDVAEVLVKATQLRKEQTLKYPVLREIAGRTASVYEKQIERMIRDIMGVIRRSQTARSGVLEKGGPYIGPRGGMWADPEHTIPYKEAQLDLFAPGAKKKKRKATVPQKGRPFKVKLAGQTFGADQEVEYRVVSTSGDQVTISRHKDSDFGPTMPKASLKHFVNDLAGRVDVPPGSGRPEIEAVTSGRAQFLGKGDDGLAFRVGDATVVKVSTTVPYQPENPGHRTPQQAADMLRAQVEVGNMLADKGIKGIQRSVFIQHGDKGFQIKPWVEIPERWTPRQLEEIQATVIEVHKAGYAIHDTIQAGIDPDGQIVLFDVGKASPRNDRPPTDMWSDVHDDMSNLKQLYADSGVPFVRRDVDEASQRWQEVENRTKTWIEKKKFGLARRHIGDAAEKRREQARATLEGDDLETEMFMIQDAEETLLDDVGMAERAAAPPGKYRYGAVNRPINFATVPAGHTEIEEHHNFPHGVVVYDKPLSPEEIQSYQLAPILTPAQIEEKTGEIVSKMSNYAAGHLEMAEEDPRYFRQQVASVFERLGGGHVDNDGFDAIVAAVKAELERRVSLEKAELDDPVEDYTAAAREKDQRAYDRVKEVLARRGYTEADYQEGGRLYGQSVNQLIDLVRGSG